MRRLLIVTIAIAVAVSVAGCGGDDDSSSNTTPTTAGGVTVPSGGGTQVNVVVSDTKGLDGSMTMTVDPATAPAGKVTFVVKNEGTITHEFVVLKTSEPFDQLTIGSNDRVSESGSLGEAGDIAKGETKSVTIDLNAGSYALVCNIAKHYGLGMRAGFTVT
jgi:uncharacterized cupredoxin-like copper-binding protein